MLEALESLQVVPAPAPNVAEQATVASPNAPKARTLRIPKLHELKNGEGTVRKPELPEVREISVQPLRENFTLEELKQAWTAFAEQRRHRRAEYLLLQNEFAVEENTVVLQLNNPVQETQLNTFKSDLTAYLREKLRLESILVTGRIVQTEGKKPIYTGKEKFDHLAGKNPALRDLKDRLGLDTDF